MWQMSSIATILMIGTHNTDNTHARNLISYRCSLYTLYCAKLENTEKWSNDQIEIHTN